MAILPFVVMHAQAEHRSVTGVALGKVNDKRGDKEVVVSIFDLSLIVGLERKRRALHIFTSIAATRWHGWGDTDLISTGLRWVTAIAAMCWGDIHLILPGVWWFTSISAMRWHYRWDMDVISTGAWWFKSIAAMRWHGQCDSNVISTGVWWLTSIDAVRLYCRMDTNLISTGVW